MDGPPKMRNPAGQCGARETISVLINSGAEESTTPTDHDQARRRAAFARAMRKSLMPREWGDRDWRDSSVNQIAEARFEATVRYLVGSKWMVAVGVAS